MTSWATETPEKVNYTKLCRLLYDGGTKAVRSVFDSKIPASSLVSVLAKNKSRLKSLKNPPRKGAPKVLNENQWERLYPPSGAIPKSADFDITLLFVLLRNINCGFTRPSTGWDSLPPPTDNTLEANLVRIKCYRNEVIAHSSSAEIDDVQFEDYWKEISSALVSLGLKQDDIDELKTSPLGTEHYHKLVNDWYLSEVEIRAQLEEIKLDTAESRSILTNIESGIADLNAKLPSIDKLFHHDFSSLIGSLSNSYHPNTRQWIMELVKSHVESSQSNPVLVIQAGPGMGKSVVAAKICQTYKKQGILGGCHFFQHSNSLRHNPRWMFQSIARQLCHSIPGYQAILEKKLQPHEGNLSDLGCEELFTELLEPCHNVTSNSNVLIVIDALDECCNKLKKEFYRVLIQSFSSLPQWLRFVITTRPPPSISAVDGFLVINIDQEDEQNKQDLQSFFSNEIRELGYISTCESFYEVSEIIELANGLFLVAYFVIDFLKNKNIKSLSDALEHFPKGKGITSVYEDYFSRIRKDLMPHLNDEEGFFRMLDAVVAAEFPIEIRIFYKILGLTDESRIPNRERNEAIHLLHQLFPVENDHVSVFHKTVIDWLTTGDHEFKVKGDGSGILANACYLVLHDIRQGLKELNEPLTLTDSEEYALEFGLGYMDEEKKLESQTNLFMFCSKALHAAKRIYERETSLIWNVQPFQFDEHDFEHSLSNELRCIFHEVLETFRAYHYNHKSSCCFHELPNFGQCLLLVLQAVKLLNIDQLSPNPLALLQEKRLPYLERKTLLHRDEMVPKSIDFLVANDRFLLITYLDQQTLAQGYQFDGTLVNEERFEGKKNMIISPGNEFVVVTPVRAKCNIDILDATTLQTRTSFKPPNVIRSCHVFGNSQSWYIVTRCFNNKIYVLKGETGEEVGHSTVVQQNDEVLAVSNAGHILLGKTCISLRDSNVEHIFVDEDENVCFQMVWNGNVIYGDYGLYRLLYAPSGCLQFPISYFASRELFLCDHKKLDHKIPIYARGNQRAYVCTCTGLRGLSADSMDSLEYFGQPVCFSDEGNLLAFYYGGFITIVRTSDGSLYECFNLRPYLVSNVQDILFLSQERIVLQGDRKVFFFKIETGRGTALEHMLFIHPETMVLPYTKRVESRFFSPGTYLYLMTCHDAGTFRMSCSFEKYEFHNLH